MLYQNDQHDIEELRRVVRERLNRIKTIMGYFLSLRQERGRKIFFLSPEQFDLTADEFLDVVGLVRRTDSTPEQHVVTNRGPTAITDRARGTVEDMWREVSAELMRFTRWLST